MQRSKNLRKIKQCRGCPFYAPPKQCLDPAIKSGWCGDWIWYVRGSKQHRRRYARPRDPRTVAQQLCRARLTAASRSYSRLLTDEQQDACIAAGAKVQSRPRLGQSGPLTGQQDWVRKDYARQKAQHEGEKAKTASKPEQNQGFPRSTSDTHRGISVVSPVRRRLKAGPARKGEAGRKNVECRMKKEVRASQVPRNQRIAEPTRGQFRRTAGVTPSGFGRHSGRSSLLRGPKARRRSSGVRSSHGKTLWRRQRGLAARRRRQPEQVDIL